jgi:uncharacterized DUF497 family protein
VDAARGEVRVVPAARAEASVNGALSTEAIVVHAEVNANSIRIISARKATKREKAHYEND